MAGFFSHARLIEDTVNKYISLKFSFDHKNSLIQDKRSKLIKTKLYDGAVQTAVKGHKALNLWQLQ